MRSSVAAGRNLLAVFDQLLQAAIGFHVALATQGGDVRRVVVYCVPVTVVPLCPLGATGFTWSDLRVETLCATPARFDRWVVGLRPRLEQGNVLPPEPRPVAPHRLIVRHYASSTMIRSFNNVTVFWKAISNTSAERLTGYTPPLLAIPAVTMSATMSSTSIRLTSSGIPSACVRLWRLSFRCRSHHPVCANPVRKSAWNPSMSVSLSVS